MRKLKWEYATIYIFYKWIPNKIWIIHILLSMVRPFFSAWFYCSDIESSSVVFFFRRCCCSCWWFACCCRVPVVNFMIFNIRPASFCLNVRLSGYILCVCVYLLYLKSFSLVFCHLLILSVSIPPPLVIAFLWILFFKRGQFLNSLFVFFFCMSDNYVHQHYLQKEPQPPKLTTMKNNFSVGFFLSLSFFFGGCIS